jgi:hypothetical protein
MKTTIPVIFLLYIRKIITGCYLYYWADKNKEYRQLFLVAGRITVYLTYPILIRFIYYLIDLVQYIFTV